jgi:hypothetical protein
MTGDDLPNSGGGSQLSGYPVNITATTRRILPTIRQYGLWLASGYKFLVAAGDPTQEMGGYIKEMWTTYVDVLTELTQRFKNSDLPSISYLLEEDEITVGFKPFHEKDIPLVISLYAHGNGVLKPRSTDLGIDCKDSSIEMQARVRDILLCGATLAHIEDFPIFLDDGEFRFGAKEILPANVAHTQTDTIVSPKMSPVDIDSSTFTPPTASRQTQENYEEASHDGSIPASDYRRSMDTELNRMVDNLVEPSYARFHESNETSYGMHSSTANDIFATSFGINGLPTLPQNTPMLLPSMPGMGNSPFRPQPNELQPASPELPKSARQAPVFHSMATPRQQIDGALTVDEIAGYGYATKSWGRNNPGLAMDQTMSPYNSNFSDSSSIYNDSNIGNAYRGFRRGPAFGNKQAPSRSRDFEKASMLQSSLYNSQAGYTQTPPGNQGV